MGACNCTAHSAEMTALVWADAFTLQQPMVRNVIFRFDSVNAGWSAAGWNNSSAEPHLFKLMVALHQTSTRAGRCTLSYEHVDSHQGECWNEAVDLVAKQYCSLSERACSLQCYDQSFPFRVDEELLLSGKLELLVVSCLSVAI